MQEIRQVMRLLTENLAPLPPEYLDHPLKGQWQDYRDCHIRGYWVLIYRLIQADEGEEIIFARTGSHSALFE
jgi:mRNA interferase YafQ